MTKDFFYQYDFYTLEQKYAETEFIKILDNEPSLSSIVGPSIQNVIDLLYTSIKENKNIEIENIAPPQIENYLKNILKGYPLYYIYFESNSKKSLSTAVFNKFLSRLFKKNGFNDEQYIIQNYLHAWLEKRFALEIVKDLRFSSIKMLTSLIKATEMLHDFYIHLINNIPEDWIQNNKKNWGNIYVSPENIFGDIRTFDKAFFKNYINLFESKDKTNLWDFIREVTRGSDYSILNEEYRFRSSVLIKKNILLWAKFWDNLELPIIQDCVFSSFSNFKPQQYLELVNILVYKKIKVKSDMKVLLLIIAKNYFETSCKLTERLSFYEEKDRMKSENEHFFKEGQKYYKEWLEEKTNFYKKFIECLLVKLTNKDIEDWIFSYKPNKRYSFEIKLLTSIYKPYYTQSEDFDLKSFNLQKFNFYVQIISDSENKHLVVNLLKTMVNFIASDRFFWDKSYSEPYWSSIKGIGSLISLHSNPIQEAKKIINKFKINYQGWKTIEIDFEQLTKESFIYSSVALLFEHNSVFKENSDKELFFKEFLNTILIQNKYSQINDYQQPLHLLFLVASQIFSDVKEYIEQKLIEDNDNLYSLLSILSSDESPICNQSKILLKERLDNEFLIEKRKFSNRNQNDKVEEMKRMITSLGINGN
jgi:hypothetical protein